MRRKREKKEHKMDDSWLLPYADLLTLLLALFIVLFSMSEVDSQKYSQLAEIFKSEFSDGKGILENGDEPIDPPLESDQNDEPAEDADQEIQNKHTEELEQLQGLQKEINNYIIEGELSETLETLLTDEGLLITILNDISFDSGSAIVKDKGIEVAREVSEFLMTDPPHQIVISGHADDRPMHNMLFASNWELSVTRAINFMTLILKNEGLDPTRFSAKGFGEHQPIVPNTSEENRAKNRRVEVLILPNYEINTGDIEDNN